MAEILYGRTTNTKNLPSIRILIGYLLHLPDIRIPIWIPPQGVKTILRFFIADICYPFRRDPNQWRTVSPPMSPYILITMVSTHPKSSPSYHSDEALLFGEGWEGEYDDLIGQTLHCY